MSSELQETHREFPALAGGNRAICVHYNIFYIRQGRGEPLLLLHDFPMSSYSWRNIIPRLTDRYDVIAPDLLGYGQSEQPWPADTSIWGQVDVLLDLLNQLNLPQVSIVGAGIGGGIAQILTTRWMKRVKRTVLINTVAYDDWPIEALKPMQDVDLPRKVKPEQLVEQARSIIPSGFTDSSKLTPELLNLYVNPWSTEIGKETWYQHCRWMRPEYTKMVQSEMKLTQIPVGIIWSEQETWYKPIYAKRLQRDIPGAQLRIVPGAGHFVLEEAPDKVAELVEDLLAW